MLALTEGLNDDAQGEGDAPFLRCLVEDQTKQMMSYGDFVMHCHRYVLSKA